MQVPNMPGGGTGRIRTCGRDVHDSALLSRPVLPDYSGRNPFVFSRFSRAARSALYWL